MRERAGSLSEESLKPQARLRPLAFNLHYYISKLSKMTRFRAEEGIRGGFLNEDKFDSKQKVDAALEVQATAIHEVGHAVGVKSLGDVLKGLDVISVGRQLGATYFSIDPAKGPERGRRHFIIEAQCGYAAEAHFDLTHEGCAGDNAQSEGQATILSKFFYRGRESIGGIISMAKSSALDIVGAYGLGNLNRQAWILWREQSLPGI